MLPPETQKERFAIGLTMPQLIWAAVGIALGFGGFMLVSTLTESLFMSLMFGAPIGLVVVPFIVYRPKERSMSFLEYLKYKMIIKRRNNTLPNMRVIRAGERDSDSNVLSTEGRQATDVRNMNVQLGGKN